VEGEDLASQDVKRERERERERAKKREERWKSLDSGTSLIRISPPRRTTERPEVINLL
jgi:hypothetical protein